MTLSGNTRVYDLLKSHPFLEEFLAEQSPKFEMLKNRMARATVGRLATLRTAAEIAGLDLATLLEVIAAEIERQTGSRPKMDLAGATTTRTRTERIEILKSIIMELHDGGDPERVQKRFAEAVADVEASEIAAMEEELIRSGLPVSEVQRLCDVHVGAFRQALDEHVDVTAPPGHPVQTYRADNREISRLGDLLGELAQKAEKDGASEKLFRRAMELLDQLAGVENHYQRKENQLFPLLERHDVTGPSKVMWGIHDEVRAQLKAVRQTAQQGDAAAFAHGAAGLGRTLIEMIYKEEKILFPMAIQQLSDEEWAEIRRGEDTLGYVLAQPAADWPAEETTQTGREIARDDPHSGLLALSTGELSLEQVNLLFTHLPVDVTYVDETDTVRFYSEGPERIFPRTPAVIGRQVQNCHPPKSVSIVEGILASFRDGSKSAAEFWIQLDGRFIHIRYFTIRDKNAVYRGCLEVSQDVSDIRTLAGERRLLEWEQ